MNSIEQLRLSGRLPSPKGVALAVLEICRREDATLDEVVKVVQGDPALSSRLLRLCNSARSGGRPVASIREAVLRLGMSTVRQVAMGFSLVDQYREGNGSAFDHTAFWSHSLLMAVACHELGSLARIAAADELFACGLLAQIGSLVLATAYPADYATVLAEQLGGETLRALERERLGADHDEVTAAVLADCGIPSALAEPVRYHERPEAAGFSEGSRPYQLVQLFFQARRMADLGRSPVAERNGHIAELMLLGGRIGLDAAALGEVFDQVVSQWQEWAELLKLPATSLPSFDDMASAPIPRPDQAPATGTVGKRVLLVADEPTSRMLGAALLSHVPDCTAFAAENGRDALAVAVEVLPQIVITDWLMPVMDGPTFCRALRATDWGQSIYVIMLTDEQTDETLIQAFEAGADDYVTKPVNTRALRARMRAAQHYTKLLEAWERDRAQLKQFAAELAVSNRRLEHAAMTDLLTGMPNRRAGMDALERFWRASQRTGQPVAALMIDVDHFKSINDQHGHAIGDQVLQAVARAIQAAARKDDSVSRIGGEEFLLVCHDADPRAALLAAERLRRMVRELRITVANVEVQTSVSIGVANRENGMEESDDMLRAADKALYAAKKAGRNRVCLFAGGRTHCASSNAA
ncbi:MAG: diguanylate cyclase [Candidatus Accumulibacter sp.]|uniref:GGDEF domain-containing response regulator n=1 Tax=Accumulibacter sp. TaxID=2053492 RepID=UPI001A3C1017|nr:diguanylate cyclase [Accumulibacter sp.]MBL8391002.1 diguanylate cyclase [Accumulibacter sp.]HRD89793.1 diguanylate cyclase [Accumulibacter sp.]